MSNPTDRKYAKSHEWVKIEGDTAIVGITDHAQDALGDITFIELPSTGKKFSQGDEAAVVESVKAASDIYAPVGGSVTGVNSELEQTPEIVNESPFDKGWIFKLAGFSTDDYNTLLSADEYEKFLSDSE